MKILVFIKEVPDVKVPVEYNQATGKIRRDWAITMLNPPDRTALSMALRIKAEAPDPHVTVIHLGPPSEERFIREALALGCDEGLRIWEEGLDEVRTSGKALIFARLAEILGFDLILMGNKSQDTGNAQLGMVAAARLKVGCIGGVTQLDLGAKEGVVVATRKLSQGYHERLESPLPLVAAVEAIVETAGDASLPTLLHATEKVIPCMNLVEMGLSVKMVHDSDSSLVFGPLAFPRSRLRYIPAPDSALPAFERIRSLVAGTIKRREARMVKGREDDVADALFQALLDGGWLSHLKKVG